MSRPAIILVNLGTPDKPDAPSVRRYLKEFLWDDRVIKRRWIWWLILNAIILNTRPKKVAHAYASIWKEDSPMRLTSQQQAEKLQKCLGDDVQVHWAMTYGSNSLAQCLEELHKNSVDKIQIIPLYPQYSATTTGAIYDIVANFVQATRNIPDIRVLKDYHQHPLYINALASSIKKHWNETGKKAPLVLSYHGIPKEYVTKGDPYQKQCLATSDALVKQLDLKPEDYKVCFQSRFGPTEWIKPYTDESLKELARQGINNVDVICPAFSADCLETLEEIGVENRDYFLNAGGHKYHYIPALNADDEHILLFKSLVEENRFF